MKSIKSIVLVGPTGVGKTDVSLEIVNESFEIISVDSVQVYRYLDIGSSKPDIAVRRRIKHYLIDVVDPDFHFTAGHFYRYAIEACNNIYKNNKYPLFIGGTAFYIDSFFKGLSEIPEIDSSVKKQLEFELKEFGLQTLYKELTKCDRSFSLKIHCNDKQRILRGLEVYRGTGKSLSSFFNNKIGHESENTLYIGLYLNRDILRERIDQRVDYMIKSGFVDEIVNLRKMGYGPGIHSMQSIGYLELNKYLDGILTLEEAIEKIKIETKKYAKRQMTWFRRNKKIQWFEPNDNKGIKEIVNKFLKN